MTSAVRKGSLTINRRKTSISLEEAFWDQLRALARSHNMTMSDFVSDVERSRRNGNLSSAVRLAVIEALKAQAGRAAAS